MYFSSFSTSFRRFSPKEEEGIWKKAFTTKTTDHNYYMCQAQSVKLIALLALQHTFHLFRKKMYFKILKTEFPHFSLTLTISKFFSDILKTFRCSLTFPWPGQPRYLLRTPDNSNFFRFPSKVWVIRRRLYYENYACSVRDAIVFPSPTSIVLCVFVWFEYVTCGQVYFWKRRKIRTLVDRAKNGLQSWF